MVRVLRVDEYAIDVVEDHQGPAGRSAGGAPGGAVEPADRELVNAAEVDRKMWKPPVDRSYARDLIFWKWQNTGRMLLDPNLLAALRSAANAPTFVDANYTHESIHRNVLLTALRGSDKAAVHRLAAALWNLSVTQPRERLTAEQISQVMASKEQALAQGCVVDLHLAFTANGEPHRLAIEMKVDSAPTNRQLATMRNALGRGGEHRLVLLALGIAQASRIEPDGTPRADDVPRWSIADMLSLEELLLAASPSPGDVRTWLIALRCEQQRRCFSWVEEPELADYYRGDRHRLAYRYAEAASDLVDASTWHISLQPHGPVLHGFSSHRQVPGLDPGTTVTFYLEVAGGKLRLKAGDWDNESDAHGAAAPYLPGIEAALRARDIPVERSSKKPGVSVSLLSLGAMKSTREAFVAQLREAYDAWRTLPLSVIRDEG